MIPCPGVCGGVPGAKGAAGLLCTVCQGAGTLAPPKSFEQKAQEVAARVRLTKSAIIAGDTDMGPVVGRVDCRFKRPRKPRMTKKRKREAARRARIRQETDERIAWRPEITAEQAAELAEIRRQLFGGAK